MPSIKKAVYGIFRQLSSNSVAPSSSNDQAPDESVEELIRSSRFPISPSSVSGSTGHPTISLQGDTGRKDRAVGAFSNQAAFILSPSSKSVSEIIPEEEESEFAKEGCTCDRLDPNSPTGQSTAHVGPFSPFKLRIYQNGRWAMTDMEQSFIHLYLSGRLKKPRQPEIYYGKTGVDLPVFQIVPLDPIVFASYSGPDGGLTRVPCVIRRPLANIANLDDELNLSYDADLDALSSLISTGIYPSPRIHRRAAQFNNAPPHRTQSMHSNAPVDGEGLPPVSYETKFDWSQWHDRAYGLSTSLYECHPFTKVHAGNPVADVFAVCARQNSCVLALADGVNWGEKSRLAARCAIRGAVENLDEVLYNQEKPILHTSGIFNALLGAFHTGHQLIIQEAGALTTLCVVVVAQLNGDSQWVACACNVGDSLAFVYSEKHGVREVTLGSHDIQQMRDMRDAGGALGPVDGVNPELHNMTCSMTTVDPGDIVFITSDGVSDNFDPVVGKFCVIREDHSKQPCQRQQTDSEGQAEPRSGLTSPTVGGKNEENTEANGNSRKRKDAEREENFQNKADPSLPAVEAYQRHELMLLRMEDLLRHGVTVGDPSSRTARDLCENLINFATQLTTAKRKILEDPDLYQRESNPREQRSRRRLVKQRISEMPGKLDHATVVAYTVGEKPLSRASSASADTTKGTACSLAMIGDGSPKDVVANGREDRQQSDSDDVYESTDDTTVESPKSLHSASLATEESCQSAASTPVPPDVESAGAAVPPLPTEPLPLSSDEDDEWSETLPTVRGPYEPPVERLMPAEGTESDSEWFEGNRVKMIDESSVSSLSGCGSTPVPPAVDEADEETADTTFCFGMDGEDLATPAQESLPPWPVENGKAHRDSESTVEAAGRGGGKDGTKQNEPTLLEPAEQTHLDAPRPDSASQTPNKVDGEINVPNHHRAKIPPLSLEGLGNVEVNLDLSSPEDSYHAFGSISISSVLECCDLIIRDSDAEKTKKYGSSSSIQSKSIDQQSKIDSLPRVEEDEVLGIFAAHGLPESAIRRTPASNRQASKCISLPVSENSALASVQEDDGAKASLLRRHPSELRSQRSLMNESYYMATAPDDTDCAQMSYSVTGAFDRGSNKTSSGRFGKLSKAFDRLERVVTGGRKHRRGSPKRHTVAVDGSQWAEMREKAADCVPLSHRISGQYDQPSQTIGSPNKRLNTSSMHLPWSPVKAFRALTSPRRQRPEQRSTMQVVQEKGSWKNNDVNSQQLKLGITITDTTADVNVEKAMHSRQRSAIFSVPHSISDTEMVSGRMTAIANGINSGHESDV